ncbi:MAG: hypothetical protein ACO2PK_03695 [Armatimonadota bacterium]
MTVTVADGMDAPLPNLASDGSKGEGGRGAKRAMACENLWEAASSEGRVANSETAKEGVA